MTELTQELVAKKLLWGLWRSISEDYKMKYPRDIWSHYENAIKSASYTSNLKGFLSLFQRRLPLDLQVQYVEDIKQLVEKIEQLNGAQVDALYSIVERFWIETTKEQASLHDWVESVK